MSHAISDLPTLTIANGATTSDAISSQLEDAEWVTIFPPATLTGTVRIQVSEATTGQTWRDLNVHWDNVTDHSMEDGQATGVRQTGFRSLRLVSTVAESAERTFAVTKVFNTR